MPTSASVAVRICSILSTGSGHRFLCGQPYYPEMPNVAKVVYKMFGNEDTMYMALTNGEIDFVWNYSTGVSATYQSVLADNADIT